MRITRNNCILFEIRAGKNQCDLQMVACFNGGCVDWYLEKFGSENMEEGVI